MDTAAEARVARGVDQKEAERSTVLESGKFSEEISQE
jgi:hypothetical protein